MTVFRHRFGVSRVVFLLAILLCLCTSRGEGLHLLPFAADGSPVSIESLVGQELPGAYQLAKTPEEGVSIPGQDTAADTDDPIISGPFSNAPGSLDIRLVSLGGTGREYSRSSALPTKFLQTASSDRSPPLS